MNVSMATEGKANLLAGCVTLGKSLNLSVPQSLQLSNKDNNRIHFLEAVINFKEYLWSTCARPQEIHDHCLLNKRSQLSIVSRGP